MNATGTTKNPQANETAVKEEFNYHLFVVQIVCFCTISVVGTLANVVICVGLSRGRLKSSEYFILNLAIADFLVCAIGIPLDIYQQYADSWAYRPFLCHVIWPSQTLLILISILTLMGMSLERHRAICSPLKQRWSSRRIKMGILFIWLLAVGAVIPYAKALKYTDGHCEEAWSVPANGKYYTLAIFIIDFSIPLTIISYCYTRAGYLLHKKFKKFSRKESSSVTQNTATMKRLQQNKNVIKIFSSAVIFFVICVLPGDCYWMWYSFREGESDHPYDNHLQAFTTITLYANSAINPFIFGACQMVCHRRMKSRLSDQLTSTTALSRSKGTGSSAKADGFSRDSFARTAVRKNVKYTSLNTNNDLHSTKKETMKNRSVIKLEFCDTSNGLRGTNSNFSDTNQSFREAKQVPSDTKNITHDTDREQRDKKEEERDTHQGEGSPAMNQCQLNEILYDERSISSDSNATLHREGEKGDTISLIYDINEAINWKERDDSTNWQCYDTNEDGGMDNAENESRNMKIEPQSTKTEPQYAKIELQSTESDSQNTKPEPQNTKIEPGNFERETNSDTKVNSCEYSSSNELDLDKYSNDLSDCFHSKAIKETNL